MTAIECVDSVDRVPDWPLPADESKMGCGNCRAVETVEKRTACFSTVPTALGKLSFHFVSFRVFHSSHSPYGGFFFFRRKRTQIFPVITC